MKDLLEVILPTLEVCIPVCLRVHFYGIVFCIISLVEVVAVLAISTFFPCFQKILVSLPELIHRRWQFNSICESTESSVARCTATCYRYYLSEI